MESRSQSIQPAPKSPLGEVVGVFLKMGLISFGGPVAHLSYFHHEFVEKRQWLDEAAFADLLALCQFLPGPASSQMVFAIGMKRAGVMGALLGSLGFMFPSTLLMILFAYGVSALEGVNQAGWLHGLKLTAVAVVAQAVWTMGRKLCPDRIRQAIGLGAAILVLSFPSSWMQLAAIALGAVLGYWLYRQATPTSAPSGLLHSHWVAGSCLAFFFGLLLVLPFAAAVSPSLAVLDGFYRAGALVFGGGHVVLPLLRAEVVPTGWVNEDAFLAGYGAAQALPGPLFTFAAYLGTMMQPGPFAWVNGLYCLGAIYLPAWLVLGGTLSVWEQLRTRGWMQAALRGTNAAVVGILLAALYTPVITQGVHSTRDVAFVLAAFGMLETFKLPAWLVVLVAAGASQVIGGPVLR